MLNLFKYELFSRKWTALFWGIGLAAFGSMYVSVYPSVMADLGNLADLDIYKAMGVDMGTFAGYIASVVVQIMPVMLGVYVIIASTGTLAGEEDSGTLELVVAMPLPRWQIVVTKAAALAIVLFIILAITGAGSAATLGYVKQTTEVDTTPMQLFTALLGAWPLSLAWMAIGLFLSTVAPSRRVASGIMTLIYIASYLFNSVAALVSDLAWLGDLSLFTYVNSTATVFTEGIAAGDVLVLLVVTAIFFALALVFFQRRNITVGMWPWQRGRIPA